MFLIFRRFDVLDKHREYMMFLNFALCINSEAGMVLSMFLIFGGFEPWCSYKIVLIKKECNRRPEDACGSAKNVEII